MQDRILLIRGSAIEKVADVLQLHAHFKYLGAIRHGEAISFRDQFHAPALILIFVGENDHQDPNWQTLSKFAEPLRYDRSMNLVFSPDGTLLVSNDPDNTVRLWDLESFTSMELASNTFLRELLYSPLSEFLFSPDGTLLLGKNWPASEPSTLCLWDTRTGRLLRHWTARIDQVAFHPRQPILIGTEYATGLVRFFDLRTGDLIRESRAAQAIRTIVFSPDGSLLALGYDSKFEIRDAETLELLKEVQTGTHLLTFSPDGKMLIVGLNDSRIQVWGWR